MVDWICWGILAIGSFAKGNGELSRSNEKSCQSRERLLERIGTNHC